MRKLRRHKSSDDINAIAADGSSVPGRRGSSPDRRGGLFSSLARRRRGPSPRRPPTFAPPRKLSNHSCLHELELIFVQDADFQPAVIRQVFIPNPPTPEESRLGLFPPPRPEPEDVPVGVLTGPVRPVRKEHSFTRQEINQLSKFPEPRGVNDPPPTVTKDHVNWKKYNKLQEQTLLETPQPSSEAKYPNAYPGLYEPSNHYGVLESMGIDITDPEREIRRLQAILQDHLELPEREFLRYLIGELEKIQKGMCDEYEDIDDYEMQHPIPAQLYTPSQYLKSSVSDLVAHDEEKPKVAKLTKKPLKLTKSLHNLKHDNLLNVREVSADFNRRMDEEKATTPRRKLSSGEYFTDTQYFNHLGEKASPLLYSDTDLVNVQKVTVKASGADLGNSLKTDVTTNSADLVDLPEAEFQRNVADLMNSPKSDVTKNSTDLMDIREAEFQRNVADLMNSPKSHATTNSTDLVDLREAEFQRNVADPVNSSKPDAIRNHADLVDFRKAEFQKNVADLMNSPKSDVTTNSADLIDFREPEVKTSGADLVKRQKPEANTNGEYYDGVIERRKHEGFVHPAKKTDQSADNSVLSHKHDERDQKSKAKGSGVPLLSKQKYVSSEDFRQMNDSVFPIPKSESTLARIKADARIYERTKQAARALPAMKRTDLQHTYANALDSAPTAPPPIPERNVARGQGTNLNAPGRAKNLLSTQPKLKNAYQPGQEHNSPVPAMNIAHAQRTGTNTFGWTQTEREAASRGQDARVPTIRKMKSEGYALAPKQRAVHTPPLQTILPEQGTEQGAASARPRRRVMFEGDSSAETSSRGGAGPRGAMGSGGSSSRADNSSSGSVSISHHLPSAMRFPPRVYGGSRRVLMPDNGRVEFAHLSPEYVHPHPLRSVRSGELGQESVSRRHGHYGQAGGQDERARVGAAEAARDQALRMGGGRGEKCEADEAELAEYYDNVS